jgi:hypothetical protein
VHLDLQDGAHSLLELAYNYQLAHGTYLEKIVSTVSLVQVLLCLITRGMHCRACSNRLPPFAVLCNLAIKEAPTRDKKPIPIRSARSRSDGPGCLRLDSGTGTPSQSPWSRVQALSEPTQTHPEETPVVAVMCCSQRPARRSHSLPMHAAPRRGDQQPPAWSHNPVTCSVYRDRLAA